MDPRIRAQELNEDLMRITVLIFAGSLLAACTPSVPDIDVVLAYDMGTVVKGELAVVDISVRNLGDGRLSVEAVSTSCGCTKATLTPMAIAPGGKARLHIEYDSAAHDSDLGRIERFIFISSNDPDENDVRIKLTVTVEVKPT